MPSDSVTAFFDRARRDRLVAGDELDSLAADPTLPQANLGELAAALAERPDLPAGLAPLVEQARSGNLPPESGLGDMIDAALAKPDAPPEPVLEPTPPVTDFTPAFVPAEYIPESDDVDAEAFAPTPGLSDGFDADRPPPRRAATQPAESNVRLWIGIGVGLWVVAILMWLIYIYKPFSAPPPAVKPPARAR